jgi:hypothetical protein
MESKADKTGEDFGFSLFAHDVKEDATATLFCYKKLCNL